MKHNSSNRLTVRPIAILVLIVAGCSDEDSGTLGLWPARSSRPASSHDDGNAADPTTIIHRAIEAHGGEDNFARANTGRSKMICEGELQPKLSGSFTIVDTFQLPDKHRRIVTGRAQGQQFDMMSGINGDDAWVRLNNGDTIKSPAVEATNVWPASNLQGLIALRQMISRVALRPDEDINGRAVHCLRLEAGSQWIDSYFDKDTHLLVASKKPLFDSETGRLRTYEMYYSRFEEIEGLNVPMLINIAIDGQNSLTMKVIEASFEDDLSTHEFARPARSIQDAWKRGR